MPTLEIITPPTSEPLIAEEVLQWLRVDDDVDWPGTVAALVTAARMQCETITNRQIMRATLRLSLDRFPGAGHFRYPLLNQIETGSWQRTARAVDWEIRLPSPPVASVTSITYVDGNGTTQTMSPSDYLLDAASVPGRLTPAYGKTWPTAREQSNAVQVTYLAGYASAALVPEPIKLAMRLMIGNWFVNRESVAPGTMTEVPMAVTALLTGQSVPSFF